MVTGIHINLTERSIVFEVDGRPTTKLTLMPYGLILDEQADESVRDAGDQGEEAERESQRTVTLTGRLKAKPREGRPDRSGNPTAYARFAAHVEGEEGAHDYIATFHRHTAEIALGLSIGVQITAQGYTHGSASERRLDTFSVFNILDHPTRPRQSPNK